MSGICRHTGKILENWPHACQSVEVILTTAIGERVMRREFGGGVVEILGRLTQPALFAAFQLLIATAIDLWEPRMRVRSVRFTGTLDEVRSGEASIAIEVDWRPRGHRGDLTIEATRNVSLKLSGARWGIAQI